MCIGIASLAWRKWRNGGWESERGEEGRLITERSEKRDLTSKGKHRRGVRPLRGEEGVEWILKLCLSERCCLSLTRISSCLLTSCERDIRCKLHALPPHIVALLYCQLFTLQSCLYFLSHILAVDATGRCPFQFRIGRSKFSRTEIDSPPT